MSDVPMRPRRGPRIALGLALLLIVALAVLWIERRPIATRYIDRTLAARGVPARYRIENLGLGRQRMTDVVLGDPSHPDLVADWVETRTTLGLNGPSVTAVRAGHVRLRATLKDGRVSLGSIDRLLSPPSGKPFALPAIDLDVADARMRLTTPYGVVGLKLAGKGRLDGGFAGRLTGASERLVSGGCVARMMTGAVAIRVAKGAPTLEGPVRLDALKCGRASARAVGADVRVALTSRLDGWRGKARLAAVNAQAPGGTVQRLTGDIGFTGDARGTAGEANLSAARFVTAGVTGQALDVAGRYRVAGGGAAFTGRMGATGVVLAPSALAAIERRRGLGVGTPVGPLIDRLMGAVGAAARSFDASATLSARTGASGGRVVVTGLTAAARSGARFALDDADVRYVWPEGGVKLAGVLALSEGGLPAARVTLAQRGPGTPVTGLATVQPYAAGGARIALTPMRFSASAAATRVATTATLSGPLGDGRIERLTVPLLADWDGHARFVLDTACVPVAFERLAVSGLVIDRSRVTLCPVDGALARFDDGRLGGGVRLGGVRLGGRLGGTPIGLAASGAVLRLGDRGFAIEGLAARLGQPDRVTRLDFAHLDGRAMGSGVAGTFTGAAGQISKVPLLLSDAQGRWTFANGALSLDGAMRVSDAAADPRFKPLVARAVTLRLAQGRIDARGTLDEPVSGTKVADVRLTHALSSGRGSADLTVPALSFDKGFQPDALTRLTFGVIADVRGTVSGEGHIGWSPDGVTSTGVFRTAGTDLAAAFGPVTGIAGEIRFTDLLALESAPGQAAAVRTINPGIPVENGVIRYRTYPGARILVDGGRWPFAGGALTLDPTLLDFSQPGERRMTFRVEGMAADKFLQQFDFKNLDATGVFDGVMPMVFDERGGRIEGGRLTVRPGGGTIAYVGPISQKDVGTWGNLAFQALKSLRYRDLGIVMNGPLAGEMVTEVRFAGISQGQGAKSNFLIRRLQRLPFVFNIRIRAPFRGLLDSAQSFYDPKRLVQRNLQSLLDAQNKRAAPLAPPIQPPASRTMP